MPCTDPRRRRCRGIAMPCTDKPRLRPIGGGLWLCFSRGQLGLSNSWRSAWAVWRDSAA